MVLDVAEMQFIIVLMKVLHQEMQITSQFNKEYGEIFGFGVEILCHRVSVRFVWQNDSDNRPDKLIEEVVSLLPDSEVFRAENQHSKNFSLMLT